MSFLRARIGNEVLKAPTAEVRLEKMKAEVIDPSRATAIEQGHDTAHGGAWAIQLRDKTTNDAGLRSMICQVFTSSILWTSSGAWLTGSALQ